MSSEFRPVGYWVKRLDRAIEASFERDLATLGMQRRHWQVLNALREDIRSEGEIERMLEPFWTEDAISWDQVRTDLTERGLIVARDGMLELTEQGVMTHAEIGRKVAATRQRLANGVSGAEYELLVRVLERMTANAENV